MKNKNVCCLQTMRSSVSLKRGKTSELVYYLVNTSYRLVPEFTSHDHVRPGSKIQCYLHSPSREKCL